MNKKTCLVVDFDDTLVKTIHLHAYAWQQSLERVLDRDIHIDTILFDINFGIDVLLKKYRLTDNQIKLAKKYKKEIFAKQLHKSEVNEFLLYVIKNKLFKYNVIASNSSRENIDKILAYHSINENIFDVIVCRDYVQNQKPSTDMWDIIFRKLGVSSVDCLMVGDSEVDQIFANKLDIECVLVKH